MAMDLRDPNVWISHLLENLPEEKLASALKDDNPNWEYIDGEIVKLGSLAHSQLDIPELQRRGLVILASESKDFRLLAHLLRTLQHAGDPHLALRLLALDDIGAVAGKDAWERALLQLFEQLMAGGGRLLVAAAAPPAASGIVLADLRSRLAAGAVFRMEPLAEADCRQALQRRAEWRGFSLPDETADFLLTRVGRGTGSLFGLLDRLDQAALVAQRRLTIPFVRSVLQSGG